MRYFALRFLSMFYRFVGVVGMLFTFAAFFLVLSAPLAPFTQLIALAVLFYGILTSVTSYAAGEFISLMIDIEQGVRNIDIRLNYVEYPEDVEPVTPKPWASFPQTRYAKPPRVLPGEDRPRPRGKWDTGR